MESKMKKLINKHWPWLVFLVFAFVSLSFLIFQRGVWSFTDSGFYYNNILQTQKIAMSKLGQFATTDGFYFGFDNSASSFGHLFTSFYQLGLTFLFGSDLGQIIYYLIYYLACFYFGMKLLKKLFPRFGNLEIGLGAIFLAFNPFSLLIATLFTIEYIYAFFIGFVYFFLSYLEKGRMKYLLFSTFFGLYLLSYLRLIPIVLLTLIFIFWIFYDQKYFKIKHWVIFAAIFTLCSSPFIIGNFPSTDNSNQIVGNYQDAFGQYEKANYDFKKSFANSLSHPGGFTPSALSFFYNNRGLPGFADNYAIKDSFEFFKIIQIIFNVLILALSFLLLKKENLSTPLPSTPLGAGLSTSLKTGETGPSTSLKTGETSRKSKIIGLIGLVIFINTLGFFVSFNIFSALNKTALIFLYNDYGFIQFGQSFLYAFLLVILIYTVRTKVNLKKRLKPLVFLIIIYLLINLAPFLSGHYGFKKINDIPANYEQTLFTGKVYGFSEATLFAPYHWLNFNWSPYFINLNSTPYSKYKSLVVPNLRLIDEKFAKFYNQIYESFGQKELQNIAIFNLKNLFVFHDVQDANNHIDTYKVTDIEYKAKKIDEQLKKRGDIYPAENNENFTLYRFNNADDYEFFIYSPKTLLDLNLNNFYSQKLDLAAKPVLLDKSRLNQINIIDEINFATNSPYISIKASPDNANKYYLKLSVMKDYPFLLQLNQRFSHDWAVYFIDQGQWDRVKCAQGWEEFKITENSRCLFKGSALQFGDLKLLTKKQLKPENHFKGNIIGNLFLITPDDIPETYKNGDELYLVIYFKKQLYYLVTLAISGLVFFMLIVLSLVRQDRAR